MRERRSQRDLALRVGRLKDDFENGRSYYGIHGRVLDLPLEPTWHPSLEKLAWHREQVFLG
jgi:putative restriction endonuclease